MRIFNEINDADMILLGVGEEFDVGMSVLEKTEIYQIFNSKIIRENLNEDDYAWMYPIMLTYAIEHEEICKDIICAYDNLKKLIGDKKYFIITMNMDSLIFNAGFNEKYITAPFGTYKRIQCDLNCNNKLFDSANYVSAVSQLILDTNTPLNGVQQEICDDCKGAVVANTINATKYNELGYIHSWEEYQHWLMGTVNKKLLMIELGVKMQYSKIVREAFEKILAYNNKARLLCVGEFVFHVDETLKDRCISYGINSVEFLRSVTN